MIMMSLTKQMLRQTTVFFFFLLLTGLLEAGVQPVIGPKLFFNEGRSAADVAVDSSGNIYMVGNTAQFPRKPSGFDAFVAKLNKNGSIIFSLILSGSKDDLAYSVAIDPFGNILVAGETESSDFPIKNAFQPHKLNRRDAFVVKLNGNGDLIYSTYLGGGSLEKVSSISTDNEGNAYIVGRTNSTNFPLVHPLQSQKKSGSDAFITKLDPSGSPIYSTFLGGDSIDFATAIAADSSGNAYIGGVTCSSDFPSQQAMFSTLQGNCDAFISKLNADGSQFIFSTYFGGSDYDQLSDLVIDHGNNIYFTGDTFSTDYPVKNAVQPRNHGNVDVFITKLSSDLGSVSYSTYFGGPNGDSQGKLAIDSRGRVFVSAFIVGKGVPKVNAIPGEKTNGYFLILLSHNGKFLFSTPYAQSVVRNVNVNSTGSRFYLAGSLLPALSPATIAIIKKTID